jgi:hypothetical protein
VCDYSLHEVVSRPAKVGDKLITTQFKRALTRGFSAVDAPNVAVCLLPGTELAFEAEVYRHYAWLQSLFFNKERWNTGHKVGRFRQINADNPTTHHDAIEFPDGQVVLLTGLRVGQRATVLQLPAPKYPPFQIGHARPAPAVPRHAHPYARGYSHAPRPY